MCVPREVLQCSWAELPAPLSPGGLVFLLSAGRRCECQALI